MTSSETAPNSLDPGTELDLQFTDLLANGQGVARASGLVVFCFGPLPGERARVRIATRKATYAVAEVVRLIETAPDRVEPFCPVFGDCGGCQVQHVSYGAQLRWKREIVRSALQRIGGIAEADVRKTIGSAPRAYRNKMALVAGRRQDGAIVGFYRARSHEIVPIDACPVVAPSLNGFIERFAHAASESSLGTVVSEARHIVARSTRGGESVVAVTTPRKSAALAAVAKDALAEIGAGGLVNSYDPGSPNAVTGRREECLAGTDHIEEEIAGIRYRFSASSFFQINVEIVAEIFACIERDVAGARNVVDLYCGTGTFSLLFARRGARVTGVEENRRAIDEARANVALNGVSPSPGFVAERVERWVRTPAGRAALRKADLVFLDPPRKGSDDATLHAIARARVARIAYLSCDPATLARDLRLLVSNGYGLRSVQPFDMFPQTGHVETLAVLSRS